jgi:hypothetical protein
MFILKKEMEVLQVKRSISLDDEINLSQMNTTSSKVTSSNIVSTDIIASSPADKILKKKIFF